MSHVGQFSGHSGDYTRSRHRRVVDPSLPAPRVVQLGRRDLVVEPVVDGEGRRVVRLTVVLDPGGHGALRVHVGDLRGWQARMVVDAIESLTLEGWHDDEDADGADARGAAAAAGRVTESA